MITLICGVPNAGKTTFSAKYQKCLRYDEIALTTPKRYAHICETVRSEGDIAVEGVYDEKWRREEFVKACHEGGHKAVCIWLDTPLEVCIERERNYRHRLEQMVRHSYDAFQPPTYDEGWDEIIIIGENNGEFN